MFKRGFVKNFKRQESDCKCAHPRATHYTRAGHCIYPLCGCGGYRPRGRQEFQNKRAKCEYGHSHNSGAEIKFCAELHYQKLAGEIKGFDAEKVLDLIGPSQSKIATYKIDFIVYHNDGTTEFTEVKGAHLEKKQPWPLKWAILQDMYKGNAKFKFRLALV